MIFWTNSSLNKLRNACCLPVLLLACLLPGGCVTLVTDQPSELTFELLTPERMAPQAARSAMIAWKALVHGGVEPKTYAFQSSRDGEPVRFVQQGLSNTWQWIPDREGRYRVRVVVTDAQGQVMTSNWSPTYEILPPFKVMAPVAQSPADHYQVDTRVSWTLTSSGGVGDVSYKVLVESSTGEIETFPVGMFDTWAWIPEQPGRYRIKVTGIDARGNRHESAWTGWKEVSSPLTSVTMVPSVDPPQRALSEEIRWTAEPVGGIGPLTYEFLTSINGEELLRQRGESSSWDWRPRSAGDYCVKVRVRDRTGKMVESACTETYRIVPAVGSDLLIAFLPMENLSSVRAPIEEICNLYTDLLSERGLQLLSPDRLDAFMRRHRMRYTGGLGSKMAKALRDEEGVDAVIVSSLESYTDVPVPMIAVNSRLVLCQETPRIAWIDGIGMTGEDKPGLLGLTRVREIKELQEIAFGRLVASLDAYLSGQPLSEGRIKLRFPPNDHYRASDFVFSNPYKIAVVPFLNRYARRNAGFVVPLHLVKVLSREEGLEVIEPGLVREQLLKYRMIMRAGPSLAISDVLSSENTLGADLVLSGQVFDYQDQSGIPKIDFSTRIFSGPERRIVWWSKSYATGDDGVFFYDFKRIRSTHVLMEQMIQAVSHQMLH